MYLVLAGRVYKKAYKHLLDFVFPRNCIGCNSLNPESTYSYICKDCAKEIYEKNQTRCLKCGEFIYFKEDLLSCAKCFDIKFYFSENFCPVVYKNLNASLVKDLKYKKALYLLDDIVKIFLDSDNFHAYIKDSILVPVPLHKNRQRKRSFNQSLEIAKAISKKTNIPLIKDLLLKIKDTTTQTNLDREMRKQNIKASFAFNKKYKSLAKDSNIIIIDDVMTTGATLNECAKILSKANFKSIRTMNFAKRSIG